MQLLMAVASDRGGEVDAGTLSRLLLLKNPIDKPLIRH
jgi:hypothetical protein